VINRLINS